MTYLYDVKVGIIIAVIVIYLLLLFFALSHSFVEAAKIFKAYAQQTAAKKNASYLLPVFNNCEVYPLTTLYLMKFKLVSKFCNFFMQGNALIIG